MIETKTYLGREVIESKEFNLAGTFQSYYAAVDWVRSMGYESGSMSYPQPIAVMKGDYYSYDLPHKWKNFSSKQRRSVHGVMVGEFRNGPVTVHLFE